MYGDTLNKSPAALTQNKLNNLTNSSSDISKYYIPFLEADTTNVTDKRALILVGPHVIFIVRILCKSLMAKVTCLRSNYGAAT